MYCYFINTKLFIRKSCDYILAIFLGKYLKVIYNQGYLHKTLKVLFLT